VIGALTAAAGQYAPPEAVAPIAEDVRTVVEEVMALVDPAEIPALMSWLQGGAAAVQGEPVPAAVTTPEVK
jgi:hypothetical protein